MSYQIKYGTSRFDKQNSKKTSWGVIAGAVIVLAMLLSPLRQAAQSLLMPQAQRQSMKEAYGVFETSLKQGSSFGDAVTAFCAQIIENAELPDET